jgi:hypothetical protein
MIMKKIITLICLCSVAVCGIAGHPRLLFTDANIAHLKTPENKEKVIALAEKNKKKNIEALCLAYRVTSDTKYAQKVRDLIMRHCIPAAPGETPKSWGWGLGPAHRCYDIAIGYDSIYDFLSPEERKIIENGLITLGIEPLLNEWLLGETRTIALDSMGHNFWSSCVFLPGIAIMAISDVEPRSEKWLKKIAQASTEWFNYPGSNVNNKPSTFDSAGGYYESVGYGAYALSGYLSFRLIWNNARNEPLPEVPLLDKVGDFFLNTCYPNDGKTMSLNFGDSSLYAVGSKSVVLLWANGFRKPRYLWYLNQTLDSDHKDAIRRDSVLGLMFFPGEKELAQAPAVPDLPTASIYKDMGWVAMRNSWDKNATLLGIKSGFAWNHSHADASSFILFHRGENIIIDSGNCWYVHPQYDAYYRQSIAHNVVLFDGQAENPEDAYHGSKHPGSVDHLVNAGDLKYVLADASGPTARNFIRNYRSFLWIDDVILIIDDLKTFTYGEFEWLLHFDGEAKRRGLDLNIKKGNAHIAVRPLFPERLPEGFAHDAPERMRLIEKMGLKDHEHRTPVPFYAIVPPGKARVMKFITAIILDPENAPEIERLETVSAHGVRISKNGKTTEVWLNLNADGRMRHRNSNNTMGGYDTDAYLLAITTKDKTQPRYFVANASYLRKDGKVLVDSLSKIFTSTP